MAPQSRGKSDKAARAFKVVKHSKRTKTTKQYRFQSFSDRVSKLNIDPVRRTDVRTDTIDGKDSVSSHFRNALEAWRDRNLTDHFCNFVRDVEALSESLPQLLHHADSIAKILLQYIEDGTALSLEPLLDLLAQFAHDLGVRFETYFEPSLRALSNIARTTEDIEIIERSLNSLVWLFRFLSRLLVPDLRPTYTLLAPLLGKEKQKPFIARFAAEALSFLLRKAAAKHERDPEPLRTFVRHVLEDISTNGDNELYQRAVMTLFVEGIKGVQNGLHSAGLAILRELLDSIFSEQLEEQSVTTRLLVARGVLTALIHHCTAETFQPVQDEVLNYVIRHASQEPSLRAANLLLSTVVAVRKGTRVTDWGTVHRCVDQIVRAASKVSHGADLTLQRDVLATAATVFQLSPLDCAAKIVRSVQSTASGESTGIPLQFFCDLCAVMNAERFMSIVLPVLQKHARTHPTTSMLVLYRKLVDRQILSGSGSGQFDIGPTWDSKAIEDFEQLLKQSLSTDHKEALLHVCNAELTLPVGPGTLTALTELFRDQCGNLTDSSSNMNDFVWGSMLRKLASSSSTPVALLELALPKAHERIGLVPFWQSIEDLLAGCIASEVLDSTAIIEQMERSLASVEDILSMPSHDLRLAGLRVLQHMHTLAGKKIPEMLNMALSIELSPFDAQSTRSVSMHIRRLATSYVDYLSDPWLRRAMPAYLLGLLHVHLSSVWTDVAEALKVICQSSEAHDVVMELAVRWLTGSEEDYNDLSDDMAEDDALESRFYTDFECSNALQLEYMAHKSWAKMSTVQSELSKMFRKANLRIPTVSSQCREKILMVLSAIPSVAEKRSRLIVPLFLEWATIADQTEESEGSDATITECSKQPWNRKDQKAMVALFAAMTNPKVLYRSQEVHAALLGLLTHGDSERQKPALKALLNWPSPALERYREDLLNLLDDDRFRDTLAKIQVVGDDIEDPSIRSEDREALMPVLLRILYGRAIAKDGANARGGGLGSRKKAIFAAVKRFGDKELQDFLAIALGPLLGIQPLSREDLMSVRKRQGLLNTLKTLLMVLRQDAHVLVNSLADVVLYCLFRAYSVPQHGNAESSDNIDSLLKDVRQLSLQTLTLLYDLFPGHNWRPSVQPLYDLVIHPRTAKLPVESAHSISGLLRLFSSWAQNAQTARFLFADQNDVLPALAACLQVESAKDEVKLFIMSSIFAPLLQIAKDDTIVAAEIQPHGSPLLTSIEHVLRGSPSKELLDISVDVVGQLGPFIPVQKCHGLIEVITFLLQQPSGRVSPKTKNGMLKALKAIFAHLELADAATEEPGEPLEQLTRAFTVTFGADVANGVALKSLSLAEEVYNTITSLFAFFEDRESRTVLCEVFEALSRPSTSLTEVALICSDLNAFDDSRLDEPAWEVRGDGWARATTHAFDFQFTQLKPLVWIALFNIRDQEDMLRSNATTFLKRYIDSVRSTDNNDALIFTDQSILQAVQRGMRKYAEDVRSSLLDVLAHAVREMPQWSAISDLQGLLVGSDEEEASFFNNILHIQQHRRMRALRRLVKEASSGAISSANIARIFLPLVEHFIFDSAQSEAEDESKSTNAGQLAAEAVSAIGALAMWLEWSQFRALLKRYGGYMKERPEKEKIVMRLLEALTDALSRARKPVTQDLTQEADTVSRLAATLPRPEKLAEELSKQILPQLTQYLQNKDESTVSRRAPVATTIVKLLRILPETDFVLQLPPVLMNLAHVLRSKADEARNLTRRTFADITTIIGPAYFGFVLKELRRALQRGYQLHVLSFTVHSILVHAAGVFKPGDLDYCINEMVAIVMDDIFGITGQDKDAEEYISTMKEVKSSKSYDSMELISSLTTLSHLADLVRPIQLLLREKLDVRLVRKIEELLRRIRRGLVRNGAVAQHGILIFCHEIWNETYKTAEVDSGKRVDYKTKRYIMNMKSAHKAVNKGLTSSHSGHLVCFSIDLMRDIIPKNAELQTPPKLVGFMKMIGDAVVSGSEETRVAVFKLIASLLRVVKAPFPRLDKDAGVYAREAMRVVRDAHSTKTDIAQAALRMVAEVLQKRQDTDIRDKDVALLLKALKSDLDEPERQVTAFAFLRAVITRRIVVPEAYELIDDVARIMVTNHSKESRKLARDAYFAFMMDYPQAKGRLDKQVAYLVKNLSYPHLEGRQSVMEILHLILSKVGNDLVGTIQDLVFLPLVMSMINDDEEKCRAFAGVLLKDLFGRADEARTKSWIKLMQGWVSQPQNVALQQAGFQCWELYLDAVPNAPERTRSFVDAVNRIISDYQDDPGAGSPDTLYFALKSFSMWSRTSKDAAFSSSLKELWTLILEMQFYPGAWVRLAASQLTGILLIHFAKSKPDLSAIPLLGTDGLELDQRCLSQIARGCLIALQLSDVQTELIDQAVQNLGFVMRCFAANNVAWSGQDQNHSTTDGLTANGTHSLGDELASLSDDDTSDHRQHPLTQDRKAFDHVIVQLTGIMRRESSGSGAKAALAQYPKTACMKLLAALLSSDSLSLDRLTNLAPAILRTLDGFTDSAFVNTTSVSAEYSAAQTNLFESARALLGKLQDKLGSEQYHATMMTVKREARERRDDRRRKRKLDVINEPERMAVLKRKKRDAAKERKKAKNQEMRGRRRGW